MVTDRIARSYIFLTIVGLWSVSYIAQINFDAWRFYSPSKISTSYNEYIEPQPLSPQYAQIASFGASEFAADLYWLQLIQYYGGGTPYGQYRKLAELFQTITELAPKFQHPYITGLIILPGEGFVDEAINLGQKGETNLPDSWEMPYYTGLVYHIYKQDYAKAGEKFLQAAQYPDAPVITQLMAGIYFKEADDRKKSYLIFQSVLETSNDDFVLERAKKYLAHLDGIFQLEKAVSQYRRQFNRWPGSLNDLISAKLIDALPVSPLGYRYTYNPQTGAIGEKISN
jgi:tetratricopeptide (TPR) repeat protein